MSLVFCGDFIPSGKPDRWFGEHVVAVGNLECAFSETISDTGKAYTSILSVDAMEHLDDFGFAALSLANNHVNDAGNFAESYAALKTKFPAIRFFGTMEQPFASLQIDSKKIAVIASLEKCRSRSAAIFPEEKVLALLRKLRPNFDRIYLFPHWGKEGEYTRYPSPRQQKLARQWIHAGADGIFGSHTHVFQGCETMAGKPVYYSLGNFYFPHPESKCYDGTATGMTVEISDDSATPHFHRFDDVSGIQPADEVTEKRRLQEISAPLADWNAKKWGDAIGAFYLKKNMASWKLRIWKKFPVNLLKFIVWNFLPTTLRFRFCALGKHQE